MSPDALPVIRPACRPPRKGKRSRRFENPFLLAMGRRLWNVLVVAKLQKATSSDYLCLGGEKRKTPTLHFRPKKRKKKKEKNAVARDSGALAFLQLLPPRKGKEKKKKRKGQTGVRRKAPRPQKKKKKKGRPAHLRGSPPRRGEGRGEDSGVLSPPFFSGGKKKGRGTSIPFVFSSFLFFTEKEEERERADRPPLSPFPRAAFLPPFFSRHKREVKGGFFLFRPLPTRAASVVGRKRKRGGKNSPPPLFRSAGGGEGRVSFFLLIPFSLVYGKDERAWPSLFCFPLPLCSQKGGRGGGSAFFLKPSPFPPRYFREREKRMDVRSFLRGGGGRGKRILIKHLPPSFSYKKKGEGGEEEFLPQVSSAGLSP